MPVRRILRRTRRLAEDLLAQRRRSAIYSKLRNYTMIPAQVFSSNLKLATRVAHVPGCVVECGVWRGGMSAGIATVLGPSRTYYLCDSFEGLPAAKPIDGAAAIAWQKNTKSPNFYDNCSAPEHFAEAAMKISAAPSFHLVKGWFNQTLPSLQTDNPIALLRLDGDWYDSTMDCLSALYRKVPRGGLIILDDYYAWDGCCRALHDFLSAHSLPDRIRSLDEVCYIIKTSDAETIPEAGK